MLLDAEPGESIIAWQGRVDRGIRLEIGVLIVVKYPRFKLQKLTKAVFEVLESIRGSRNTNTFA